jgi:hypothetical protein
VNPASTMARALRSITSNRAAGPDSKRACLPVASNSRPRPCAAPPGGSNKRIAKGSRRPSRCRPSNDRRRSAQMRSSPDYPGHPSGKGRRDRPPDDEVPQCLELDALGQETRRTGDRSGGDLRGGHGKPGLSAEAHETALTAGSALTPHLPHRSVDDLVDPPLVTGTRLPPDLPDDQTELHRRGEQALDAGKLITRREGLRPPKHRVQLCAACRHDHAVRATLDVSRPPRHHGADPAGHQRGREPAEQRLPHRGPSSLRLPGIPWSNART